MTKRQKDRQYNDQKTERQNIITKRQKDRPKDRKTDNIITKRQKDRQYNYQKTERQTI